jgi:hypothetical protein
VQKLQKAFDKALAGHDHDAVKRVLSALI